MKYFENFVSYSKSLLLDERPTGLCVDQQKTIKIWTTKGEENQQELQRKGKVILTTMGLLASNEEPIVYTWMKCT